MVIHLEAGQLGVGVGAYVATLWALGLDRDLATLAAPERDDEGQTLAAARAGSRVRPSGGLDDDF